MAKKKKRKLRCVDFDFMYRKKAISSNLLEHYIYIYNDVRKKKKIYLYLLLISYIREDYGL
jgi:hypothetical protein